MLTITVDLEDHRRAASMPVRYERTMREQVLPLLDRVSARATVFVVGTVAERSPLLIREIAAAGHELALHAWDHEPLDAMPPGALLERTRRGVALLGDLTGHQPLGYRAASFSLTAPVAAAATDMLRTAGFEYSSSVLPAPNPLYGYPGAPTEPFMWPSGLIEFPAPLLEVGPLRVPLGGTYLRALPAPVLRRAADRIEAHPAPWIYCHPYDFDVGERFWWEPVAGPMAPLLWVGRRTLGRKLEQLLTDGAGPTLADRAAMIAGTPMPTFEP